MNEDFHDFLAALLAAQARFMVVGAHALAVHGVPRATGDLDVWIAADGDNGALSRATAPYHSVGRVSLAVVMRAGSPSA